MHSDSFCGVNIASSSHERNNDKIKMQNKDENNLIIRFKLLGTIN